MSVSFMSLNMLLPFFTITVCFTIRCFSVQSPDELIEMAYKYYDDTALPKLVLYCTHVAAINNMYSGWHII